MPKPLQVLILEDRQADAELMVRELRRAGFEPDWKRVDNESDFEAHLTPSLQAILSDFAVPGFGALQALEILHRRGIDIPFIIVSGTVDDARGAKCLAAGAADYLLKDRLARLGPAVERALREHIMLRERKEFLETIQLTEDQLRSLFDSAQDVVWSRDARDGRMLYLNLAAQKLFQRPVQEYLDDPSKWLQSIHPDDREHMAREPERLVKWGTTSNDYRILRPDGEVRNVSTRAWCKFDSRGKPVRLEGIIRDVTDERRTEEQRRAFHAAILEAERLTRLHEYKSRFLNMVAHDLNNVLTPMRLNLYTLQSLPPDVLDDAQQKALRGLDRSVVRLAQFLADLLDAARLQSGNLPLSPQPMDLACCLREAVDTVRAQADEAGIQLEDHVPAELPVEADPHRVSQVVSNLLSNALKFTPPKGRVRVAATSRGDEVEFSVTDTGRGIRKQDMLRLFQPFSQLGGAKIGKHAGTGLGLFICHGLVEQHGGRIWCDSPGLEQGSTFTVRLPVRSQPK